MSELIRAISLRQPWAWLVVHGHKDIENRTRATCFRGRVLIHASAHRLRGEYRAAESLCVQLGITLPSFHELERGGIVGAVRIKGCVSASHSPWFTGPYGYVLSEPEPLAFRPLPGRLGFFAVPESDPNNS